MNNKNRLIPAYVGIALFAIGTIVFIVLGALESDADTRIFFFVIAAICGAGLLCTLAMFIKFRKVVAAREVNLAREGTIAYKVLGEGTPFKCFCVTVDSAEQAAAKAMANVIGAVSLTALGTGVFVSGKQTLDCFVSDDELIIGRHDNLNFDDEGYACFKASDIERLDIEGRAVSVHVAVYLTGGRGYFMFNVSTVKYKREYIFDCFDALAANIPEQAAAPAESSAGESAEGDLFD